MIISASRRTDIPSFYSDWFLRRIEEGFVLVPNPFSPNMISRIKLTPDVVDCIVFWTKNPTPMLHKLNRIKGYNFYFQFTLNPYGQEIEKNIPALHKRIEIFKRLSDKIGKEKVIWRYDPIFINDQYNIDFHKEIFAEMTEALKDYTEKCMLGFIDHYRHIKSTVKQYGIDPLKRSDIKNMVKSFKEATDNNRMILETCTVKVDLNDMGINTGMCIDKNLVERLTGYPISAKKDKNQRDVCQCIESIDIGTYESCLNGCVYCYAIKSNENKVKKNRELHDKNSPMLFGYPHEDAVIKEREVKSLRNNQKSLF